MKKIKIKVYTISIIIIFLALVLMPHRAFGSDDGTIDIIKKESFKKINYDILFYFSFFFVIALLIFNALYIQDAYLYHIALEINLAYAFVSFYTLVMPSKE